MRILLTLLLAVTFLSLPTNESHAQNHTNAQSFKMSAAYRNGAYDYSGRLADKIITKYESGSPKKDKQKGLSLYQEALIHKINSHLETNGRLEPIEPIAQKYLNSLLGMEQNPKEAYLEGLARIAKVYSDHLFYKQASAKIEQAQNIIGQTPNYTASLPYEVNRVYVLNNLGFYDQAYQMADALKEPFINSTALESDKTTPLRGKYLTQQKRHKADFLNLMAEIQYQKGDYIQADSLLRIAYQWITTQIPRGHQDVSAFDNRMLKIKLLQKLDRNQEAYQYASSHAVGSTDGIKKSLNKTLKGHSYYPQSESLMEYESYLARHYWSKNGLTLGIASKANSYYAKHHSTYSRMGTNKQNIQIIKPELLLIDKHLLSNNLKYAKQIIDSVLVQKNPSTGKLFVPHHHPMRRVLLLKALEVYELEHNTKALKGLIQELEFVDGLVLDSGSTHFFRDQLKMANILSNDLAQYDEALALYETILIKNLPNYHHTHPEYRQAQNHYIDLLTIKGQFERALLYAETAALRTQPIRYQQPVYHAMQEVKLAQVLMTTGQYNRANNILKKSSEPNSVYQLIQEKTFENQTVQNEYYQTAMSNNLVFGELSKAKKNYQKIEQPTLKDLVKCTPILLANGDYSKATEILEETMKELENQYGPENPNLLTGLNYLSKANSENGEFGKASNLKAILMAKNIFGNNSWQYADALAQEGNVLFLLGDYKNASRELYAALNIYESVYGTQHLKYANTLSSLSLCQLYSGNQETAIESNFYQSSQIIQNVLSETSFENAQVLKNLAFYYLESNEIQKAEQKLNESIQILTDLGDDDYKLALAETHRINAKIQQYNKAFKDSENSFNKSLGYYNDLFNNKKHPEITQTKSGLAQLYYVQGDRKDSRKQLNTTTELYLEYISEYFNYLTEREKKEFWKKIKTDFEFYNTIAFEQNNPKEIETVYNNTLNTKALLLSSSKKLRKTILESSNQEIKKQFEEWSKKQELLTKALSMSTKGLSENGIDLENLQKQVDKLEKSLGEKSNAFAKSKREKSATWQDVRAQLQPNEYAIEIIRYRKFTTKFTDEIVYKALVIGKDYATPKVVDLANGNDLDNKFLTFYRNTSKFKIEDPYSYDSFFKPIHQVVGHGSKLYISLDGAYHLINIEALRMPNGEYVIDKNEIVILSNTKELITRERDRVKIPSSRKALFIGNPMYYPQNITSQTHQNVNPAQNIPQLEGAEKEAISVAQKFKEKGWQTDLYLWDKADEELIRNLGKSDQSSYSYIHISTHGFFRPPTASTSFSSSLDTRRGADDPYTRAGLLLKNGGEIMDNQPVLNYNTADGIWTAKEVANQDLEGIEIIVLSACETGLGEVASGEGVYGLQRAFQSAGVGIVINSLFKVDDTVTNLFMNTMSQKYLETFNKRQALIHAKKVVRAQYPDPIYWGSFVMME